MLAHLQGSSEGSLTRSNAATVLKDASLPCGHASPETVSRNHDVQAYCLGALLHPLDKSYPQASEMHWLVM